MKSDDAALVRFLDVMADVREQFRKVHIRAENAATFTSVTTSVSPFRESASTTFPTPPGVSLSFFLDASLNEPDRDGKSSIGVSVTISRVGDQWLVEGEVGWTYVRVGWDSFEEAEIVLDSSESLMDRLPTFAKSTLETYEKAVADYLR